jgi:predicted MFS family arabinose efflux permease
MVSPKPMRMRFQITGISIVETVINSGYRMVYPFLPFFAQGLGVDLARISLAVAARSSLGVAGPLVGAVGDIWGRKRGAVLGCFLFSGGLALVAFWPTYLSLFVGLLLVGAGRLTFMASVQAYLGDQVHYTRRGTAIAITEFGWSWAYLLGMPVIGWLIARAGWASPFPLLGLLGLGCALCVWRLMSSTPAGTQAAPHLMAGLRAAFSRVPAAAGLAFGFLALAANESINIVYGTWMVQSFSLKVAALGAATALIGLAEWSGEGLVALFSDRLGKRRAVGFGIGLNAVACLLIPTLGRTVFGAIGALVIFYVSFEFATVTTISIMTELVPEARATLLAGFAAAASGGRAVGALVGPALFAMGVLANGSAAAVLDVLSLVVLLLFIREGPTDGLGDQTVPLALEKQGQREFPH